MCEIKAFLLKNGQEELFLENVESITFDGAEIHITSIFEEEKKIKARPVFFNNSSGKILFEMI